MRLFLFNYLKLTHVKCLCVNNLHQKKNNCSVVQSGDKMVIAELHYGGRRGEGHLISDRVKV